MTMIAIATVLLPFTTIPVSLMASFVAFSIRLRIMAYSASGARHISPLRYLNHHSLVEYCLLGLERHSHFLGGDRPCEPA